MRRLTDEDLACIKGRTIQGYRVVAARIKQGPFVDSNRYGFLLGRNMAGEYVTWQFHLTEDESVSVYWGHFIMDRDEALRDFNARGMDSPQWFDVTITETLQLTVRVEDTDKQKAEQIVAADWRKREFALGPEHFSNVEFKAESVTESGNSP